MSEHEPQLDLVSRGERIRALILCEHSERERERVAFGSFNNRYGYDSLTFEGMHVCMLFKGYIVQANSMVK